MRKIKMFEEFEFDEITQIVTSMFEETEIDPVKIDVPSGVVRIWRGRAFLHTLASTGAIDLHRYEEMLDELGWGIHLSNRGYCVVYEKEWWNFLIGEDLNGAAYGVQTALGQDDGGFAGMHFSDTYDDLTGEYQDQEEAWWKGDDGERHFMLMEYLIEETRNLYEN